MFNIIDTLVDKRARLLKARRAIREEADRKIASLDAEISQINEAIDVINDACKPLICTCCGGTGEERYTDGAGSRDTRTCTKCGGTGIAVKESK